MTIFYIIIILFFISITLRTLKKYKYFFNNENNKEKTTYIPKQIMTEYEYKFYITMKPLENEYIIVPQLNLASIIKKNNNNKYYTELFRNIDFAIFTKNYTQLLLLIEINDNTHKRKDRKDRDLKVLKICEQANIPLIKFYTSYPNEQSYVINRIKTEIEKRLTK